MINLINNAFMFEINVFMKCIVSNFSLSDAKTTAPAWPNLSSVSVSGKNLFMEPVEKPAAPADKGNEGKYLAEDDAICTF